MSSHLPPSCVLLTEASIDPSQVEKLEGEVAAARKAASEAASAIEKLERTNTELKAAKKAATRWDSALLRDATGVELKLFSHAGS